MGRRTYAYDTPRGELLAFKSGDVIANRYKILSRNGRNGPRANARPLGEGATGVVYLATPQWAAGKARRAVKFFVYNDKKAKQLGCRRLVDRVSMTHFSEESRSLSSFNHQNVLKVFDADTIKVGPNGTRVPFLVSEFMTGETLEKTFRNSAVLKQLSEDTGLIISIVCQLFRGLHYLHRNGFYHCDIAPKNIFLQGKYPEIELVIGDLGLGRPGRSRRKRGFVLDGTPEYCPDFVQGHLQQEITQAEFCELQPTWDCFAAAKTICDLLEHASCRATPRVLALTKLMEEMQDNPSDFQRLDEVVEHVEALHPDHQSYGGIMELAEQSAERFVLPVESVAVTARVKKIINHPAILRLAQVPQLVMASAIFPAANHTRYEHSLGAYQGIRRFLIALQNDSEYLKAMPPRCQELALVCALLSNCTRFPFSTVIHEIKTATAKGGKSFFEHISRRSLLDDILTKSFGHSEPLEETIRRVFPNVDLSSLVRILAYDNTAKNEKLTTAERFIHFLLNSSIDARVLDYLRRDSLHVGFTNGGDFDAAGLAQHLRCGREGELRLRTSGLSIVEQVVATRYWMFNRLYWNRQSRSLLAAIRHVLTTLAMKSKAFEQRFREIALVRNSEVGILHFFDESAREIGDKSTIEICELLLRPRPKRFREVFWTNRAEGGAEGGRICDDLTNRDMSQFYELQDALNNRFINRFPELPKDRLHLLLDVPLEPEPKKFGEDLVVVPHRGNLQTLSKFSSIVEGVQRGFKEHVIRARVFVNPRTQDQNPSQFNKDRLYPIVSDELSRLCR